MARGSVRLSVGVVLLAVLAMPVSGSAQVGEIVVTGTVTDATDAVLPGVTVEAVHIESGTIFVGVTNTSGLYRIPNLRVGLYNITAQLPGFSTVTQAEVELEVGDRGVIGFELSVGAVEETITVTGESPLIDIQQSKVGGTINARQMEALPINGRDWMSLTMLSPGSRVNSVTGSGSTPLGRVAGAYQINVDGQQTTATQTYNTVIGNPGFSRDAIAEFEMITSRFDATQGRSLGVQVNAVSKSGTNTFSGSAAGYFRNDRFTADDHVLDRKLPFSNQQVSVTFGGPIVQNKLHFFSYYEGEREPHTIAFASPFPSFNIPDINPTTTKNQAGFKLDATLSQNMRLMFRGNGYYVDEPVVGSRTNSGTNHPTTLSGQTTANVQGYTSLTQTFGGTAVNILQGGYLAHHFDWFGIGPESPEVRFRGYTLGHPAYLPIREYANTWSVRNDFTMIRGAHELKIGGDFQLPSNQLYWANLAFGRIFANGGPIPDNVEELFPVWDDPSTWNLAPLSPITTFIQRSVGTYDVYCAISENCRRKKPQFAGWIQDNWQFTNLTLNLGLRWDYAHDALANEVKVAPVRPDGVDGQRVWDFGPRLGFAYSLNDARTVLRGGWGLYWTGLSDRFQHFTINNSIATPELFNDGRPNFASDPFNLEGGGSIPTLEEARASQTTKAVQSNPLEPGSGLPYSQQTSIGFQHQIGRSMAFQADYVWNASRDLPFFRGNSNMTFDPNTGVNLPYSNPANRFYPEYGRIGSAVHAGVSDYHALETLFQKRFTGTWQASATYTLSRSTTCDPLPFGVDFPVAPDIGGECSLNTGDNYGAPDQRHRLVLNSVWELPYDFQLSNVFFFGSGQRYGVSYGTDLRDSGNTYNRLRADGTIIPREGFKGDSVQRLDVRVTKRFRAGGVTVDAIAEVFNLLNRENFARYTTTELSSRFREPVQSLTLEYQPRMAQFGFRVTY
jgi:hypothetical protein